MKARLIALLIVVSHACTAQVITAGARRAKDFLYNIVDSRTGQVLSFKKAVRYFDGTPLTAAKCDNIIYIKYGADFFERVYDGAPDIRWFGADESRADNERVINQVLTKYGAAFIPQGVFTIAATVTIPDSAQLYGQGKFSVLKLVSRIPTDAVKVGRKAVLKQVKIDCTATEMDLSAAILVPCWRSVESYLSELLIQDIAIEGNYPKLQGVGLKLSVAADGSKGYAVIAFCKFYNIDIYGFRDGILLDVAYEKGNTIAYINGNAFDNLMIHRCLRPVRCLNYASQADVVAGKATIAYNHFTSVIIQHVVGCYPAFELDGASYNKIAAQVIDWSCKAVEISNRSVGNQVNTQ